MGISAKPIGKLRGIFRKLENEELKRKEELKRGTTNKKDKKETNQG